MKTRRLVLLVPLLFGWACISERQECMSGSGGLDGWNQWVQVLCSGYLESERSTMQGSQERARNYLALCAGAVVEYTQCGNKSGRSRVKLGAPLE